jgi:hypothetical protein
MGGRTSRWRRRALVIAVPALLLSGCAQEVVTVDTPPSRPVAPAVAAPSPRPGCVIAAPQGTADPVTRDLAAELARRTGFALVVTPGIAVDPERVREAARGPLAFYAELRGSDRREAPNRIAIATAGIDDNLATRLRTLYELIRDAYVRAHPGTPAVELLLARADAAGGGDAAGGRPSARTLHLDLPRIARTAAREPYTAILADFLSQAAALPAGR